MATTANYTPYDKGINGIMIDVYSPTTPPLPTDFAFTDIGRDGTAANPVTPTGFQVRPGEGVAGSDRVVITFGDDTLRSTWLQVDIGTGFGLPASETAYWGNAVGDSLTPCGSNIIVDFTDVLDARNHQRNFLNPAPVGYPYDYNKDRLVDFSDVLIPRKNLTNFLNAVKLITR